MHNTNVVKAVASQLCDDPCQPYAYIGKVWSFIEHPSALLMSDRLKC